MDFNNTSDFVSGFWSLYITVAMIASVVGVTVFLLVQDKAKTNVGNTTGHVWDETLEEYNNPLPNWWRWMFYITLAFAFVYLALYPGLGSYGGSFGWSMRGQWDAEMKKADEQYAPIFNKFLNQDIRTVAANPEAKEIGQRLFLTYCTQCHGSDAKGGKGFPNLTDSDWLWGGTPDKIKESITKGRDAMMPAKGTKPDLTADEIKDLANFVRSLSGLSADPMRVQKGKELFQVACIACHGPEGKGNVGLAPNLTDKTWLYGSSEAEIINGITHGRVNRMPAWGEFLGEAKVHLLTAYVYGLGGGVNEELKPEAAAPAAVDSAAAPAAAPAETK